MKLIRQFLPALLLASFLTELIPPPLVHQIVARSLLQTPIASLVEPASQAVASWLPTVPVAKAANIFLPYSQNFDGLTANTTNVPSGWVQVVGDGTDIACGGVSLACNNWIVYNTDTPTTNTGPATDYSGSGNYLYVEATTNDNSTVQLLTPSFNLVGTTTPQFSFWVHRWDNNNTGNSHELRIDVVAGDGSTVITANALTINNSALDLNAWTQRTLDLTSYRSSGDLRILFRWFRNPGTNTGSPDIAIDNVNLADNATLGAGIVTGRVFRDYNANGSRNDNEPGISNVTVSALSATGVAATTTTAASGYYRFDATAGLTGNVRVEFTLPTDNSLSYLHAAAGGQSTVQFVNVTAGVANVDVGFYDSVDYCQANPQVAVTNFFDSQYNGAAAAKSALLRLPYNASGHDFTTTNPVARTAAFQGVDLTRLDQLGAIYGVAWQRTTNRIYLGAYHKRYSGFGPNGPDAIYQTNAAGTVTGVIELDSLLGIANSAGSDAHDFAPSSGVVYDIGSGNASYDGVGKRSFGDLEFSSDMSTLYVVNLFDRKIYAINVSSGNTATATLTKSWNAPDATGANRHRPFALAWSEGKLWVGSVDDNGSNAYVHSLDPAGTTFTLKLTVPLNYTRQNWIDSLTVSRPATWRGWAANPTTLAYATDGTEIAYPQPMLTDLAFTHDSMILGFRDRMGDQGGADKYFYPGLTTKSWTDAAGDILRACSGTAGYVVETGLAGACANPTAAEGRSSGGPAGYEYYFWDIWEDTNVWNPSTMNGAFHWETAQGALVQLAGKSSVLTTAMDPFDDFGGGLLKLDHATGKREGVIAPSLTAIPTVGGYTIYDTGQFISGYPPVIDHTFAKANGLGDIEALCDPAPLEIGNRVWVDSDYDGIQDPGEAGLAGVTVQLYAPDGTTLVATAVTDAQGEYYFSADTTRTSTSSRIYNLTTLLYNTTGYLVRIGATQSALTNYQLTLNDRSSGTNSDLRDADGVLSGTNVQAAVTTGVLGANDHTVDFGFIAIGAVTGHLFVDTNGNGSQQGGEPDLPNVTIVITDQFGVTHAVVSDSSGNYTAVIPIGAATVNVDESTLPALYTQTAGSDPTAVTVTTGATTNAGNDGYQPPQADLTIKKYDLVDPLPAGTTLTYTIYITNNGPSAAVNVIITDTLPAGTTFLTATSGCSSLGNLVICTFGTIPVGTTRTVTIVVRVDPTAFQPQRPPQLPKFADYFALAPPHTATSPPQSGWCRQRGGPPYVPT